MASKVSGVWAIDIGTSALKALQMQHGEQGLEVVDFAYHEHARNLASGDVRMAEKEQIISDTLGKFLEEKDLSKSDVAISIAGQNSFARFIKLPPVEPKKIPEIVQFEAVQQIPFDINEVEWDWQLMEVEDSPDKEVGLFAIKNELISEVMDHFTKENLRVTCVQIAPMALYNYAFYDLKELQKDARKAIIILDVGAENTTLVICTRDTVWQRSIRIGGNTFTEAIADTFKKNYPTAEKLKRTAPMSKYMRQIYTAMKSVYSDFGSEIQRSLGFYSSSPQGRDKTFTKVIALGGGMKLQGLAKYLTQTLGMTVVKPDSFENLSLSPDISTAKFHENVSDFGVAYGLGVQMLGEGKITTNMLPRKIARAMAWTRKAKLFTIAAAVLLLVMLLGLGRTYRDYSRYKGFEGTRREINAVISKARQVAGDVSEQEARKQPLEETITKAKGRFEYRQVVPSFIETVLTCLPNKDNNVAQAAVYDAFDAGDAPGLALVDRSERMQLFVTRFAVEYSQDVESADFPPVGTAAGRTRTPGMALGGGRGAAVVDPRMILEMRGGGMEGMAAQAPAEAVPAGFTVLIEGYSPYARLSELLDPPSVLGDTSRWGLITRLANLNKIDSTLPFEMFNKHDIKHFKVDTGLVVAGAAEMPAGIGILREVERVPQELRRTAAGAGGGGRMVDYAMGAGGGFGADQQQYVFTEKVLIDPMTGEEISKTFDIVTQRDIDANPDLEKELGKKKFNPLNREPMYIERDRWFRIRAKFVWKEAPKPESSSVDAGLGMY